MQRAAALKLKGFIEEELGDGLVRVELAKDSPAGYTVTYEGRGGGFTLTDVRQSEAFIKGFATAKGILGPMESNGMAQDVPELEAAGKRS